MKGLNLRFLLSAGIVVITAFITMGCSNEKGLTNNLSESEFSYVFSYSSNKNGIYGVDGNLNITKIVNVGAFDDYYVNDSILYYIYNSYLYKVNLLHKPYKPEKVLEVDMSTIMYVDNDKLYAYGYQDYSSGEVLKYYDINGKKSEIIDTKINRSYHAFSVFHDKLFYQVSGAVYMYDSVTSDKKKLIEGAGIWYIDEEHLYLKELTMEGETLWQYTISSGELVDLGADPDGEDFSSSMNMLNYKNSIYTIGDGSILRLTSDWTSEVIYAFNQEGTNLVSIKNVMELHGKFYITVNFYRSTGNSTEYHILDPVTRDIKRIDGYDFMDASYFVKVN